VFGAVFALTVTVVAPGGPAVKCVLAARTSGEVELAIENTTSKAQRGFETDPMLLLKPGDAKASLRSAPGYFAKVDMATGGNQRPPAPTIGLERNQVLRVTSVLSRLRWAHEVEGGWPDRPANTLPTGQYTLYFAFAGEVSVGLPVLLEDGGTFRWRSR
jgi:hypothetical protein